MKTTELFEGITSESGDDVSLSMRPTYTDGLTININYRTITQPKEGEEFIEQRQRARRADRKSVV